jgi:hypothetical protein
MLHNIHGVIELRPQVYREKEWPIPREPRTIEVATVPVTWGQFAPPHSVH